MLCKPCQAMLGDPHLESGLDNVELFFQDILFGRTRRGGCHHPTYYSFIEALEIGCGICWRILECALKQPLNHIGGPFAQFFERYGNLKPNVDPSSFSMEHVIQLHKDHRDWIQLSSLVKAKVDGKEQQAWAKLHFFLAAEQRPLPDLKSTNVMVRPISESLSQLQSWVAECRKSHLKCRRAEPRTQRHQFARILDVGDDPQLDTIKLCTSTSLDPDAPYLTLSHCWGGTTDLDVLTKDTYGMKLQSINVSELPRTFRDTIYVTRKLQLRYLWIDSLCIIQDSHEDWYDQAQRMGDIYHGSYLNIAATDADNPHGGLFLNRAMPLTSPLRVQVSLPAPKASDEAGISGPLELEAPLPRGMKVIERCKNDAITWTHHDRHVHRDVNILVLNNRLGNHNGSFDVSGYDFMRSSRARRFERAAGTEGMSLILRAELRTREGHWIPNYIDITKLESRQYQTREQLYYDVGINYGYTWHRDVSMSNLCNRAWIVQERMLAPRVVHFTDQQLLWECQEHLTLEQDPDINIDTLPRSAFAEDVLTSMSPKHAGLWEHDLLLASEQCELSGIYIWMSKLAMIGAEPDSRLKDDILTDDQARKTAHELCYGDDVWIKTSHLLRCWASVLETYGSCVLTRATDRLIAIDGLAQILRARTGATYVNGLWLRQLPRQLLWAYLTPGYDYPLEAAPIAPTWSWASNLGGYNARHLQLEQHVENSGAMDLIKCEVQKVESSATELPINKLRVRGRLLPITVDAGAWPQGSSRPEMLVQYWTASTPRIPTGSTFLVPVVFSLSNSATRISTTNSLLIEATAQKGTFRRVGTARLSHHCTLRGIVPQLYAATIADHVLDHSADATIESIFTASSKHTQTESAIDQMTTLERFRKDELAGISGADVPHIVNALKASLNLKVANDVVEHVTARAPSLGPDQYKRSAEDIWQFIDSIFQMNAKREIYGDYSLASSTARQTDEAREQALQLNHYLRTNMDKSRKPKDIPTPTADPGTSQLLLAAKDAITPQFYLDYIEDEDSTRYGCFVFDII